MFNLNEAKNAFQYFVTGWHLICQKGLRRFVIMPILLNILLLSGLFWLFIKQVSGWIDFMMSFVPDWLSFLSVILLICSIGMVLLLFYFVFNTLSNFIAAPFNGLLAEKVEKMLTGEEINDDNLWDVMKDVPRMLKREWQKLWYSLPKIIALFLLGFIPLVGQTIVPVLAFLFTCWMMAIQYCDYPFDNHKVSFAVMKSALGQQRTQNLTFGALVSGCAMVPFVNFLVMPVAVCAATVMWVENYRSHWRFEPMPHSGQGGGRDVGTPRGTAVAPKGNQIVQ